MHVLHLLLHTYFTRREDLEWQFVGRPGTTKALHMGLLAELLTLQALVGTPPRKGWHAHPA
eukprot:354212-Chlamydomonas_euryale.AAC.12